MDNIYDILNNAEIDLNQYEKEDFTVIEKIRIKNKLRKSIKPVISYKKFATATVAVIVLGVCLFGTNIGAYAYIGLNSIVYDITKAFGIQRDLAEYKTVINQSITKGDLTIRLNEVVLDNGELVVSTTLSSVEKLDNMSSGISLNGTIYINGKNISSGAGGSASQTDDCTVEQVMTHYLDLETVDLSGDLNVKIVFTNASINEKPQRGNWVFEFKTNGDELTSDTKEIKLDTSFTLENGQIITLEKYTNNDLGPKIYFSISPIEHNYHLELRGVDDLANPVDFFLAHSANGKGVFKLESIDNGGEINENAKTLTLIPYSAEQPKQNGRTDSYYKKTGDEFIIDLTK